MRLRMSAEIMPMITKAKSLHGVIGLAQDRIFNVEIYSGLTESAVQINDGKTSELKYKRHVMQRRCYMDNDLRTRIDYLKWAPLLLAAEEYHAGSLKVQVDKLA